MADEHQKAWISAIDCAISNSMDYSEKTPTVNNKIAHRLEEDAIKFIMENSNMSPSEAKSFYLERLDFAARKKRADGKIPFWVPSGALVGIITGIINGYAAFSDGIEVLFCSFFLISVWITKSSFDYMKLEKRNIEAAKIWNEGIHSDLSGGLYVLLNKMNLILFENKNPSE